jgi:sortase A
MSVSPATAANAGNRPVSRAEIRALAPVRDLNTRSLTAIAILIAGLVVLAQAFWIPLKAQVAQGLMDVAWQRQVRMHTPQRPWPWADFAPAARLRFPNQHKAVLALSDAAGESLAFGPTLMAASAAPGQPGVAVFAAHRDTHFAFLGQLKAGDPVTVEMPNGPLTYRITGSEVVRWDASGIVAHDGGASRIALVTCWPLDALMHGPMRYGVWAELVKPAG